MQLVGPSGTTCHLPMHPAQACSFAAMCCLEQLSQTTTTCECADHRANQNPDVLPQPQTQHVIASSLGAYSQRERHSQRLEDSGAIKFEYIQNDGDPASLIR